jgi:hypothetical protein
MSFNVEETLLAGSLPADVLPHLLWNELLMGTEKRRYFLKAVETTDMLRGAVGTKISVPILSTRFSAGTISESNLDTSGYTVTDPAVTDTDVTIGDQVYVAFRISDILKEDQPKYDWVRALLRDAGRAITEYEDAAIRDVLLAGAGNTMSAATYGTLDYDDVVDLNAMMKTDSWFPDEVVPYLFIHPNQEKDLVKDTRFLESHRYAIGSIPGVPAAGDYSRSEAEGYYGDFRVLVSDNMVDGLALVVFPTHPRFGPVAIHAYKRPLTVRTDREELYGRQLWVASMRYGTSVIQANAVGLISAC